MINISQMKKDLENKVVEVFNKQFGEGIVTTAAYDIEKSVMHINIMQHEEKTEKTYEHILFYNVSYTEESGKISIAAFNRVYVADELGVANVVTEPVAIDNDFMTGMSNIIMFAMKSVTDPKPEAEPTESTESNELKEPNE